MILRSSVGQVAGKPEGVPVPIRVGLEDVAVAGDETYKDFQSESINSPPLFCRKPAYSVTSDCRSKCCCESVLTAWGAERSSIRGGTIFLQVAAACQLCTVGALRLIGVGPCDSRTVQRALFTTARLLVATFVDFAVFLSLQHGDARRKT